jgi:hypothetical protein
MALHLTPSIWTFWLTILSSPSTSAFLGVYVLFKIYLCIEYLDEWRNLYYKICVMEMYFCCDCIFVFVVVVILG